MKKTITYYAHLRGLKLMAILFALLLFSGQSWAAVGDTAYILPGGSGQPFGSVNSYAVKTGSYTSKTYTSVPWTATYGSCQNASTFWLGSNSGNKANLTLGATYVKVGTPCGIASSDTYVAALIAGTNFSNIGKVTVANTTTGGTATTPTVWVVYSTDNGTSYSLAASSQTASSGGTLTFTFTTITSARYAIVVKGTNDWTFRVPVVTFFEGLVTSVPTVTTNATPSAITATAATFGGNVTDTGGVSISANGIVYSLTATNATPAISGSGVTQLANPSPASGKGAFSLATSSALSVNSQYSYRAYATNSVGTSYGGVSGTSFYTLANIPTAPTVNNATINSLDVTVNVNDNPVSTEFAIHETSTGKYVQIDGSLGVSAYWQNAAAWGTKTVIGLTAITSYTFEVKARNGATTETVFGATQDLSTLAGSTPILTVNTLISFGNQCINGTYGPNSFTITGENLTTADVTVVALDGFAFSTLSAGTYSSTLTLSTGIGGSFSQEVFVKFSPLVVQSYNGNILITGGGADNVNRSVVGSGINTTASISTPTAASIGLTSVTLGGDITAIGCSNVSERGIYWSASNGFLDGEGTKASETSGPYGTGTFTVDVSGLTQGTPYYYKAFATNNGGTVYTSQGTFTTLSPSLSVGNITDFGSHCINTTAGPNSFTITGTNLTNADITLTALDGYTYSLLSNDAFGTTLSIPQSGGSFSQLVYVQFSPEIVQSYNGNIVVGGGGASNVNRSLVGSCVNTAATVTTTNPATSITANTVTLGGEVTAEGCQSVTTRGFCYGTSLNPDLTGSFTTEIGTTGVYSSNLINLIPNTTYHFRAYATTTAGTSYGSDVTFTSLNLTAPTAKVASAQNSTGFTANWNAIDGASSYRLDVSTTAGFLVNAISENFTGFTINNGSTDRGTTLDSYLQSTGWTAAKIYEMPGYAKLGSTSGQGIITTPTINLAANSGNATLTFDLGKYGTDVGLVQVYHAADGTSFAQIGSDITPPATLSRQTVSITGGTANSKIKIQAKNATNNRFYLDSIVVQYSTILASYNDLTVSDTSHEVSGLNSNTNYYYRVRAYSATSTSANSNVITVLTAPAAPVAIAATNVTTTGFKAKWNASTGASGYKLEIATDDLFSTIVAGYNGLDVSNVTNYSVSGLDANTTYYYRVAAYNIELSLSPYSSYITLLTAPETPTAIDPTNIAANGFTANWNAVAGADGYGLYVSTDINFGSFITGYNDLDVLNVTNYNISGLSPNTTYYYRVYAYNSNLDVTENSNTITVLTTPAAATASITHPSCTVGTGTIEITAPLGADYEYSLDLGTYQSSTTFADVSFGGHTIYVRSASVPSSVSEVSNVMVNDQPATPSIPMVSETQPNCTSLGSIEVTSPLETGMTYSIGLSYQSEVLFASLAGGTYTVTAKNSDGCISQGFEVVLQNQPSTPSQATVEVIHPTCTEMFGTITVTAPIGSDLSYSIDDMDYTNVGGIFNSVNANTYNVTVKNTSGCISEVKIATVNSQPATPLQPLVSVTQPSCTVNTATLTVTSDITDLFFSIDGIDYTNTTGEFSGIAASSTYSVTARNADGCVSPAATGTIAAAKVVPLAPHVVLNQPNCFINSGTITASVNNPSPSPMLAPPIYKKNSDIFYSIDGINYTNTTGIFSTVSPGNYFVTIKNESNCISPTTDITINPLLDVPTAPIIDVIQPSCTESTATITVTSSTSGLEFSIDGIDYTNTTGVFTGIIAGSSYSITARNADGCISLATTGTIDDQPLPPTAGITNTSGITTLTCTTTFIDVTATGGVSYSWSDGATIVGTSDALSITLPATYTVTVTGSNGCTTSDQITIGQDISTPTAAITNTLGLTTLTCTTTSIDVTTTGTGSYSWSDGATEVGTSAALLITSPATYTVTVTASNGCIATDQITIDQDIATPTASILNPSSITTLTCTTTSIDVTANGGVSYSWSNGALTADNSFTSPDTYTVTVTGTNGCTATDQITIDQDIATPIASILNSSGLSTLTCTTTSIDVTATGGNTYSWSDGTFEVGTSSDFSITSPATYTVTVTGSNGCTATDQIYIDQDIVTPSAGITNTSGLSTLTCTATSIDVTAYGGVDYSWSDGTLEVGTLSDLSISSPATYTVTVTGSNGCTATDQIYIDQDIVTPLVGITNTSGLSTLDCTTTSIDVTATGGNTYSWSDGMSEVGTLPDFSITSPATYTVTVTGSNGCTATDYIIVNENVLTPSVGITNNTATSTLTCTTTSIDVTATGGVDYSWSDGTFVVGTLPDFSITSPATYTVTVTGSNGCTATDQIYIDQDIVTPSAGITNTSGLSTLDCTTTSIDVTATGGVDYSWSNGTFEVGTSTDISITSPAAYTVIVTGDNGCTATDQIIIDQDIEAPIVSIMNNTETSTSTLTCTTTSIDVTATGGVDYSWSDGTFVVGTSSDISITSPATYTVTVTGSNGCTATDQIYIDQDIEAPTASITNNIGTSTLTCITTSIDVTATGGVDYSWSNGTSLYATASDISISSPATYTVTVTGSNGCTATDQIIIGQNIIAPSQPTVSILQPTCSLSTATISVTSTISDLHFSKDSTTYANTTGVFANIAANSSYSITAKSANGCISSAATGTINNQPTTPTAPTATAASSILSTGFTANWNTVSGATGYKIDVSTSNTFANFVAGYNDLTVSSGTSKVISGLSANTTYYYRVRVFNASCTSVSSNVITVTTFGIPTVTTTAISSVLTTTATSGGNVTVDGGLPITARGVCWNISGSPTVLDSITSNASGTGVFISNLTGLLVSTTYYVKAYATNSIGTAYGSQLSFTTASGSDIIVTNNNNAGSGSLREALANITNGGIIRFVSGLDGQTITLTTGTLIVDRNVIFENSNLTNGITISGSGNNITINAGKVLTLSSGSKLTVTGAINNTAKGPAGLVIASGASFIHNTVDLPATVQRNLTNVWHLFGSPFKKNTGAMLANITGTTQMMPYTNGTGWGTTTTSPVTLFAPSVGYAIKPNATVTASFTGNLYYSAIPADYTTSLIYNGTSASQSWNLVANPYTSSLDWNLLGKTNLSSTLYYWDNAYKPNVTPIATASYMRTYNSCNGVGVPAGTNSYIAPLQGFFVKAVYTSPKLSFTPSARVHKPITYYKDASNTEIIVRLKTETEEGSDELVICKNDKSKLDFEQFDSEKLFSDSPVEIYSQSTSGEKLVINTINTTDNTIIPLGIRGNTGKKVKISAFALETAEQVYLEDRFKGKLISLAENTAYEFELPTENLIGRFFIRFSNTNAALTTSDVKVFENDNELNIIAQTSEDLQTVEVYSLTGACVFKAEGNTNVFNTKLQLAPAIYMVRVKTSIATQNVKVSWK